MYCCKSIYACERRDECDGRTLDALQTVIRNQRKKGTRTLLIPFYHVDFFCYQQTDQVGWMEKKMKEILLWC